MFELLFFFPSREDSLRFVVDDFDFVLQRD